MKKVRFNDLVQVKEMNVDWSGHAKEIKEPSGGIVVTNRREIRRMLFVIGIVFLIFLGLFVWVWKRMKRKTS